MIFAVKKPHVKDHQLPTSKMATVWQLHQEELQCHEALAKLQRARRLAAATAKVHHLRRPERVRVEALRERKGGGRSQGMASGPPRKNG